MNDWKKRGRPILPGRTADEASDTRDSNRTSL
jgi:hypothetical protein